MAENCETEDRALSAAMQLTDYQANYFAHELTKRCPSDSVKKIAGALASMSARLKA